MAARRSAGRIGVLACSVVAAALYPGAANGAPAEVEVGDDFFRLASVSVSVDETVTWQKATSGSHSVHQLVNLFDSGSPTSAAFQFQRVFSAGTFKYVCEVHSFMDGTVKVPVTVLPDGGIDGFPLIRWASASSNTGNRFDVQYKVGSGKWKTWLTDRRTKQAIFGDDDPVELKVGTTYRFRARSQKGTNATRVSNWSPARPYVHE